MNQKALFVVPPWLCIAGSVFYVTQVWSTLPPLLAVHFDLSGHPNGWQAKGSFIAMTLGFWIGLSILFSFLLSKGAKPSVFLPSLYFTAVAFVAGIVYTIRANTGGNAPALLPAVVLIGTTAVLLWAIWSVITSFGRMPTGQYDKSQFLGAPLIAVERHRAGWQAVIGLLGAAIISSLAMIPSGTSYKVAVLTAGAVTLVLSVFLALGFRYEIRATGVLVKGYGVTLRFIAAPDVNSVLSVTCNPLRDFGGWGIRGGPHHCAYILGGHTALRIKTTQGEFYLGTREPDRLAQEIRAITR